MLNVSHHNMKQIHTLASIITIITALLNIGLATLGGTLNISKPVLNIEFPNFPIKLLVFFYLELSISLVFAYIKSQIRHNLNQIPSFYFVAAFPLIIIGLLASGWTSLFNIEWFFIEKDWGYSIFFSYQSITVIFWGFLSLVIMWFAGGHIDGLVQGDLNEFDGHDGLVYATLLLISMVVIIIYKYQLG